MKYKNVLYTKDRHRSFPNSKSFQVKGERHYNACKTTHETGILTSIWKKKNDKDISSETEHEA